MKKSLLLLGVIAALAVSAPAYSQYIYLDVNADGLPSCPTGTADALTSSVTAVDVWLNTNHDANGTVKTCNSNATQPLTMFSYDILFNASGSGSVAYTTWTNAVTGFAQVNALTTAGTAAGTSWSGPTPLTPGLYKLGTLGITVTGTPVLGFRTDNVGVEGIPTPITGFGTNCDATTYFNTYTLGIDFVDNCGTVSPTPTLDTTWGKIKALYR